MVSPTAAAFYLYKFFWSVLRGQALETLLNRLNLTWPKDSQNLLRDLLCNLLRIPLNLTWLCTKASWKLLRNLLRNPVEPELALHQSLADLLRNLLRNPVEPNLSLHLRNPLNLTWLCTKVSWNFLRNLLRNPVGSAPKPPRPSPEPSPKPYWTLPGSAPKPPRPSPEPSPEPSWTSPSSAPKPPGTFSGTLLNLTWLCTKASQTFSGTFSENVRNPVEPHLALEPYPELSPEPCWTSPGSAPKPPRPSPEPLEPSLKPRWTWPGACTSAHRSYSGLKAPLAYAVGEKIDFELE